MSLKSFHILFIVLSTCMTISFAVWGFGYSDGIQGGYFFGFFAIAATLALIFYGVWFLKRLKHIRV